jgi:hypothetical protein
MRSFSSLVFLFLLLIGFALPTLCAALPAGSGCASEMISTSHGDHCPRPSQPRACCQVDHETPMTVPAARLAVQPALVSAGISNGNEDLRYAVGVFVATNKFTSPPPAVLRI